jgi:predicted HNH restriction endonuclease
MSSPNGSLSCEVCNFFFQKAYGKIGEEFIEAHHKIPVSSMNPDTVVRTRDLAPVCSNCHRMLHRHHDPWLTVEELKDIVNQQKIEFAG